MENINKFVKENYKLLIPMLLMLVLFIVFFVYYKLSTREILTDNKAKFYQYFYGEKYDYEGIVTTNRKNVVVDVKPVDIEIEFDSTPIYYKGIDSVIFPKDMSVVMPTLNCAEYLSKGYSVITYDKEVYKLVTEKYDKKLNHYFLYDSKDLYFFIEEVLLKYDDKEIKLSPFSYVVYKDNSDVLIYYDKVNDKYETISDVFGNVTVSNDYYTINVNRDYIDYYGSEVLLTTDISKLNTIDMKD